MLLKLGSLPLRLAIQNTTKHVTFTPQAPRLRFPRKTTPLMTWVKYVSSSHSGSVQQASLESVLKRTFPKAVKIEVNDISGGCGAMFELYIVNEEFRGMSKVKQHMLVNKALAAEISNMHGIRIFTTTPDSEERGSNS